MQMRLKGIHTVKAKGRTYYYAWRGGPRLRSQPGSADFIASYNEAVTKRKTPPEGKLFSLIAAFKTSTEFRDALAPRTKTDYLNHMKTIEAEFGDFPLSAIALPETRGIFKDWRDRLAEKSLRQADYAWTVLARILSVAKDRGKIPVNPCEKGGRLYRADRSEKIWTAEDEAAFLAKAPAHLHLAILLALWTGQRQGDLLRLPWSAYDGQEIRLRQGKTKRRVVIPVGAPLKAALDSTRKRGTVILTTIKGTAWTSHGFSSSWRKACAKAGIEGLTFHDLRGSAVTRLALAGSTVPEIADLTGLSLADVNAILDAHYLSRNIGLARNAITKLETGTNSVKPV